MNLGKRLRELREKKGLSQQELAKLINVGKTTVSNYETEYSSPDNETIIKIADVLDTSTDYLLGRDNVSISESSTESGTNDVNHSLNPSIPKALIDFINSPDSIKYLELAKDLKAKGIDPHDIMGFVISYKK